MNLRKDMKIIVAWLTQEAEQIRIWKQLIMGQATNTFWY